VTAAATDDGAAVVAALESVRARIHAACASSGRALNSVRLLAVSKFHSVDRVRAAYGAGQRLFGENYAQELETKALALAALEGIEWHAIGHLQRNKARVIVQHAAMVQSVDSARLASALDRASAEFGRVLPVLVQVNVGAEAQKSGCAPGELRSIVEAIEASPNLALRGLMTIPPHTEDPEGARPFFDALATLREQHGGAARLPELSMGMTHDLEQAIACGATIVRVGTAIFGERP
jgi:pyridoxal phosphate enzyme (YggS family)